MSRRIIPLKTRVRYEGRAKVFDRRATVGADLEKLPDPIWYMVGFALRGNFRGSAAAASKRKK
jgi:hypothetical protein